MSVTCHAETRALRGHQVSEDTKTTLILVVFSALSIFFICHQAWLGWTLAKKCREADAAAAKSRDWLFRNYPDQYYRQYADPANPWDVSRMEQVYQGNGASSSPVLSKSDHQIFGGSQRSGAPVFSIHGDKIYRGSAMSGNPVATISGDAVYLGNAYSGTPLATISGKQVYQGKNYSGTPLATTSSAEDKELLAAAALRALGH